MRSAFLTPVPGEWYYTVNCRNCGLDIRFFPDETKGTLQIRVEKTIQVHCPHCYASDGYHTSEMTSTQEPKTRAQGSNGNPV